MLKLCENGSNIDYLHETSSVLRKAIETEISGLTFWLRFRFLKTEPKFGFRTSLAKPKVYDDDEEDDNNDDDDDDDHDYLTTIKDGVCLTWVEQENVFKADVFLQIQPQFADPSNQFRESVLEARHRKETQSVYWYHVTSHLPSHQPTRCCYP